MRHPYQCIETISARVLILACGPRLLAFDVETSAIVSEWVSNDETQANGKSDDVEVTSLERPAKKLKIKNSPKAASVTALAVSADGGHVVAITDDKNVHVLANSSGELSELSQRYMPKRPCAVQILPDNATVLIGDKFGDVYSIPLLPTEESEARAAALRDAHKPHSQGMFQPAASNLTVHSQRNLRALQSQRTQKITARKEALQFEHKLLLGHVSMLTDLKHCVYRNGGKKRRYIITADRDEHIRLSRGIPQTHVIEGFCLGHTEFVSKICVLGESGILVSGGGDPWLGIWNWPETRLLKKFDLLQCVRLVPGNLNDERLAVSGIWFHTVNSGDSFPAHRFVLVACEKVNALFVFSLATLLAECGGYSDVREERVAPLVELEGCPLDIACLSDRIIVSVDVREDDKERLSIFRLGKEGIDTAGVTEAWEMQRLADPLDSQLTQLNTGAGLVEDVTSANVDSLLYGVADLRKRRDLLDGEAGLGEQDEVQEGAEGVADD